MEPTTHLQQSLISKAIEILSSPQTNEGDDDGLRAAQQSLMEQLKANSPLEDVDCLVTKYSTNQTKYVKSLLKSLVLAYARCRTEAQTSADEIC